jgi:hypothetical protein
MTLRKFFVGRAIGLIILLCIIGIISGFYALNNFIYKEKQADPVQVEGQAEASSFTWRYEKADSLNLDGLPETNIFLEVKYTNEEIETKLIDTTPGSCNDLPDSEEDSVINSTVIQCYSAGLGYTFKITKGVDSYLVMRKTFEEGLPDYEPPMYEYETVAEIPFSK